MVDGITYILFTACLTSQQVNQTFIVAIKLWFILYVAVKLVNSSVIFMLLQSWHLELPHPQHPTLLSTGYNLDLTM